MKNRRILRFLVFALAIVGVALWLVQRQRAASPARQESARPAADTRAASETPNPVAPETPTHQPKKPVAPTSPQPEADSSGHEMQEIVRRFNETHNLPVAFYGQVVDQDGEAVPDVKVKIDVQESHMVSDLDDMAQTTTHLEKQTGSDGRFEVAGLKGDGLDIEGVTVSGFTTILLFVSLDLEEPDLGNARRLGLLTHLHPLTSMRGWRVRLGREKTESHRHQHEVVPRNART